jgi:hypothetical protein
LAREKLDIVVQRGAPKAVRDELLAEAKLSLAKMERVSGLDGLVFLDRPELSRRYDDVAAAINESVKADGDPDPLAALARDRQEFYREVIKLIYRHSTNRVAAKALVDRIFEEAGLGRLPKSALALITKM